jgi:hypothetical protein
VDAETYEAFWKVPAASDGLRLGLYVRLPLNCTNLTEPVGSFSANAYAERWSFRCSDGLAGRPIHVAGLTATLVDVLVRLERLDESTQVTRLSQSTTSFIVEATPQAFEVAYTYFLLGFEHILTGVDHLLFIAGLLLLVSGFWRVVKTVSAFTLSHTVTLTLATLGFVRVPPAPVEAVIALSIIFVACEIARSPGGASITRRKPWVVAFSFGLLHGLGFAGGLSAAGLPANHIPSALALFSVGVEAGHFCFVAGVLALFASIRSAGVAFPRWAYRPPAYAIGSVAAFWLIARIAAF